LSVLLVFHPLALKAASATWSGAVDGDWTNAGNWSPSVPGTPGGGAITDVATFNVNTNTAITVDSGRVIGSMIFDTGAGAFQFSGGPLLLNNTSMTLNAGVVNSQTFRTNITANASGSGPSFTNNSTTQGVVFNLNGDLAARTASGGVNFNGSGTGIIVRGNIINNPGGGTTSISRDFNGSYLILRGTNTYTGTTLLTRGIVLFDSVSTVGGAGSSFGAPTTVANGTITAGASTGVYELSMVYTGTGHTTDRAINVGGSNTMGANLTAYGTGALQWDGNIGATQSSAHSFSLAGTSTVENRVGGIISNSTSGGLTSLTKSGGGTWNLAGANTYTGNTTINSGLLRLDFSNASAPSTDIISSSSALIMKGGTLALRGKTTGSSSQTVNNLTLNSGYSKLEADGNGGTSTTLNLGTITRSGAGTTLDVTLASTGVVTTSTSTMTNSVISSNDVAYATVNGSDWATYNAGNIEALGSYQTATSPGSWASTDNVSLSGNPSANVATTTINTLRLNGASTVTIDPSNSLTVGAGGILLTGTGNTLITGGSMIGSGGATKELVVFQHKSSGTAEIASTIANNGSATGFTKTGDGILTLSGTNTYTGATTISGGVLKMAGVGTGGLVLNGGVLGLTAGDYAATLNTPANGRVQFLNSGGFAAYGADRTVTLNAGAAISWGATNFVSGHDALIFGASDSDGKLIFTNPLNLQGGSTTMSLKEFRVNNGSAAVDAELSGVISSTVHGGLVKTGEGTLLLSNANTYDGPTIVTTGTLIVNGSIANSMLTTVSSGAKLAGNGTTAQIELMAGGAIAPGNSIGMLSTSQNGNSNMVWNGETSGSFGQMQFELSTIDNTSDNLNLGAGVFDQGSGSIFAFDFLGTGGSGYTYTLVNFGLTDFTVDDFSYSGLASGLTGIFTLNADSLQFTTSAIPEPSTYALLVGGLGLLAFLRRRKQS